MDDPRRHVPSVDRMLKTQAVQAALAAHPRWAVLEATRDLLDAVRSGKEPIPANTDKDAWIASLGDRVAEQAKAVACYSLQHVINATGVVLHTNLGRAPLSDRALEHVVGSARGYSNLELDLASGKRGSRYSHVESLLCDLSGAEAALIVNNNAAAVVLCLSELAHGREVIVSRGEMIEIGGSFRIPSIMEQSGATLVEVGTTNRTRAKDYDAARTDDTAVFLKVHPSNYRIIGFTEEAPVPELVKLAQPHGIVVMNDLGSGSIVDLRRFGLPHEPTVRECIAQGADIVTFSGDKLLGGPQIGAIAGKKEIVQRLKRHPLLRALRVDKLTLSAFEATLRIYRDSEDPEQELPVVRMLAETPDTIRPRAEKLAARLGAHATCIDGVSQAGGGSLPDAELKTVLVAVSSENRRPDQIEAALREHRPAIMVRVQDDRVLIDLRTVFPREEEVLAEALLAALTPA